MKLLQNEHNVLPSLEEQGIRQIYPKGPDIDHKKELRELNHKLQHYYVELSDLLIDRLSLLADRMNEITTIIANINHLLNSLRPRQALDITVDVLELQIERRKNAIEDIKG